VALLWPGSPRREIFIDRATVHVGEIRHDQIETYISGGAWRGKAGAYNLMERIEAGWPIRCDGDPSTVMGLPMRLLLPRLANLGATVSPQGSGTAA
jgi:predicted house-cleaning NTP pyrophosphatase (Maf/HAM1 superfamily)